MNKEDYKKEMSLKISIKRKSNIKVIDDTKETMNNIDSFLKGLECFDSHVLYDVYHGKKHSSKIE